jgi:hypothetical protein
MSDKVPDGWQLELWWPESKESYPQKLAYIGFSKEVFWAEFNRRLADDPRDDYMIIAGPGGFEVYQITKDQI